MTLDVQAGSEVSTPLRLLVERAARHLGLSLGELEDLLQSPARSREFLLANGSGEHGRMAPLRLVVVDRRSHAAMA